MSDPDLYTTSEESASDSTSCLDKVECLDGLELIFSSREMERVVQTSARVESSIRCDEIPSSLETTITHTTMMESALMPVHI